MIEEKDKEFFNKFISTAPHPHFLQTYEWGELKRGTSWVPLRLLVTKDETPIAAISLLKREVPLIKKSILYAPRGPILGSACDQPGEEFFWREVQKLGRKHQAIFVKIDPAISVDDKQVREKLQKMGFRPSGDRTGFGGVQPRYVFRMDVTSPNDDLLAGMASKTRYNLRLSIRRGVKVRVAENKDDLAVFYDVLQETAERDHFLVRDFSYFERMWDLFVEEGKARVFLAQYKGEVLAGTIAFHCGDTVWYLYGASSNRHRNVMPNYLLQWTMIQWAKDLGCKIYDFRGVPPTDDPSNPLAGLYRFKKGFGAQFTEFIGEYDLVLSPFWYFFWTQVLPLYLKVTHYKKEREGME